MAGSDEEGDKGWSDVEEEGQLHIDMGNKKGKMNAKKRASVGRKSKVKVKLNKWKKR